MTRLAAVLLWVVLAAASPLLGAQSGSDRAQPTTVLLDFGFGGQIRAGEWAPVRIAVSPMDDAVQAVARIRIDTPDGGQITSVVPVATTPGRETVVPTTLWIPPSMSAVYVDLVEQGGRPIASTSYGAFAGAQAIQLPVPSTAPLIVGVGTPSLRMAFGTQTYEREFDGPEGLALRERAATARVASTVPATPGGPPWLPVTPIAYNGVTVVVVDGQLVASLDPDGVRGLREWLVSGGRLMVVNADNLGLQQLLGEYVPEGLRISPARELSLPESLGGPGGVLTRSVEPSSLPAGWSLLDGAEEFAAEGPMGLGWMMVLGFDPDGLAERKLAEATEIAWHGSLATMIDAELEAGRLRLASRYGNPTSLNQIASSMAMGWVGRAPRVGMGAFIAIFAMMLALAVALGPVDRLVLKRLRRLHRWWLAALAWIALASVGAWIAPRQVRSGPTTVSSVRVIDSWQSPGAGTRAWQHGFDGLFLNRSARIGLDDLETSSWLSPLTHQWIPGGIGTLVMTPQGGTMRPQPTAARLWTTRLFEQQGVTAAPVGARFEIENQRLTLRLGGPMASSVQLAAVYTAGRWLHMMPGGTPRREGDTLVLRATMDDMSLEPPPSLDVSPYVENDEYYGYWGYDNSREAPPGLLAHIGRSDRRTRAFETLGGSDDWAVVYLSWKDGVPQLGSGLGEEFDTRWVCRLAVPVVRTGTAGGTP